MTFVGRQAELDLLQREISLALQISSGKSLFLVGSAGAGKTALAAELLRTLGTERPELSLARGRCLQTFGSADPYLPFVDALRDLSDEATSGFVRKETVSELLTELAPYWLSVVPMVGGLLSAGFATAAKMKGSSNASAPSREALFVQYLTLIRKLAGETPLVLFLDDLHWADQSSIALLTHLSRGISDLPVVLVGTLRVDETYEEQQVMRVIRELEREDLARVLKIGDLEGDSLDQLLRMELSGDPSEPLRRWLTETAGGNPLFATELVRWLKQREGIVEVRGEWHLNEGAAEIEVPRTAEAVIESRIQRLDTDTVKLLQYASVEGNEFDSVLLSRLLEQDELELLDVLERVERRHQLVETIGERELPDGDVATRFRFRHALVQTVLYRQVVGKRRILLHRKAAETIEALFSERLDEVARELAVHFHRGRLSEPAFRYAWMAAGTARLGYAHWEAEELYRIALEHAQSGEDRLKTLERLGDVYGNVGFYDQGVERYQAALADLGSGYDGAARLRRKRLVLQRKGGLRKAPELLSELRAMLAESTDDPSERLRLLLETSMIPGATDVEGSVREALALAERQDDPGLTLEALERLIYVLVLFGSDARAAFPFLDRAGRLSEELDDPVRIALHHNVAGIAHARVGELAVAAVSFESMLEMAERIGDPRKIGVALSNLGTLFLRLGELGRAEETLQRAYALNQRRDRSHLVHSMLNLAERARLAGDIPLALERYEGLVQHARDLDYWDSEAVGHAGAGLCHLAADRLEEARSCSWQALAVVADREEWFEDRDILETFLARLEHAEGDRDAAVSRLDRTALLLRDRDSYLWARTRLERITISGATDPLGPDDLEEVRSVVAGIESPPLQAQFQNVLQSPAVDRPISVRR